MSCQKGWVIHMNESRLLLDDQPLIILPRLAKVIGLNESIILQQLHYWLQKRNNMIDGIPWVYNTHEEWQEQFPFWSIATIRRTLSTLENSGILVSGNYNQRKFDKTKWYTINYEILEKIQCVSSASAQNEQTSCSKRTEQLPNMSRPIPETTTETTTDITTSGSVADSEQRADTEVKKVIVASVVENEDLAKVMTVYQNNIHPITGGIEADNLTDLVDTYSARWVEAAIGEAVKNSVRKLSYIIAILERWKTNGIDEPWLKKKDGKNNQGDGQPPSGQIAWEEVYDRLILKKEKNIKWSSDAVGQAVKRVGFLNLIQNGATCMAQFVREYNEVIKGG